MNIRKGLVAGVLALGLTVVAPLAGNANAKIYNANPDNLQQQLDAARDKDDIVLDSGEYKGVYTITKKVTVRGNDKKWVKVNFFRIKSSDVKINNLTVGGVKDSVDPKEAHEPQIKIDGVNGKIENVTIDDVNLIGSTWQIVAANGSEIHNLNITNNKFTSNAQSFYTSGSTGSDIHFDGNTMNGGTVQIVGKNETAKIYDITFNDNTDKNGTTDLRLGYASGVTAKGNNISRIDHKSAAIVLAGGVNNVTFIENHITNYNSGIQFQYNHTPWPIKSHNDIATIEHNKFENTDFGISFLAGSMQSKPIMSCNTMIGTSVGIILNDLGTGLNMTPSDNDMSKCTPAPTTPDNTDKNESGKTEDAGITDNTADNNANGAKAPNTGAVSVIETLAAITGLSTVAIAGAIYARKRAYNANK